MATAGAVKVGDQPKAGDRKRLGAGHVGVLENRVGQVIRNSLERKRRIFVDHRRGLLGAAADHRPDGRQQHATENATDIPECFHGTTPTIIGLWRGTTLTMAWDISIYLARCGDLGDGFAGGSAQSHRTATPIVRCVAVGRVVFGFAVAE